VTSAQDEIDALKAENDALKAQVSELQVQLENCRTLSAKLLVVQELNPSPVPTDITTDEGRAPGATGEPLSPSSAAST
jgi:hypothetical protein